MSEDHHKETFITKYIFCQDHKIIAKQFLITGMLMGIVGMVMSLLFRLQLSNPGESFAIFEWLLGEKWAPEGILDPNMYLALVTMPRNNFSILGINSWFNRYICKLLNSSSNWSKRYGIWVLKYVILLVLFWSNNGFVKFIICRIWPSIIWMDSLPSTFCPS